MKIGKYEGVLDHDLEVDKREHIHYDVTETLGGLQFHSVVGNGMLFSRDLKIPTESEDLASLITDKSVLEAEIADKEQYCIAKLEEHPYQYNFLKHKGIEEVVIDDIPGLALYASNKENEEEEMIQVILFHENERSMYCKEHIKKRMK